VVGIVKDRETRQAEEHFFSTIEDDPVLFYRYQLGWVKQTCWHRLGNEFGGMLYPGPVASLQEAGQNLVRLTKGGLKQIDVTTRRRLPLTDNLIRFTRLTYSFLKDGEPTLFFRNGRAFSLSQLCRNQLLTPMQAANYILNRLDGV
ncbi:MAG: hypothetical protein R3204_09290, partial [Oceanospirillum sp.]|nr:hypothetical protein [Oceanospirillum sp.]